MSDKRPILEVKDLSVGFPAQGRILWSSPKASPSIFTRGDPGYCRRKRLRKILDGLLAGRAVAQPGGTILSGPIRLSPDGGESIELVDLPAGKWRDIRGKRIGMIFQEPSTALNPVVKIGRQLKELYRYHPEIGLTDGAKNDRIASILSEVGFAEPSGSSFLPP